MPIHLLPPDVTAKIAAGEVVERPLNAVKELVENSLDAGADEIRVEIREGGHRLLRVSDNGHGLAADEAALAFERHATSKLSTADDLEHIVTFGFRGEALYSIAAVSQTTLTTRRRIDPFGTQVRLEAGVLAAQTRAAAPVGTVISIEHLFYNVPARRKFLRKPAAEAGQIAALVQRFALAHPDRRFSLVSEGRLVFQSTGGGDLFDVLVKVYGLEEARQMTPVGGERLRAGAGSPTGPVGDLSEDVEFMDAQTGDLSKSEDRILVSGYASLPTLTRANRSGIEIFVNRRLVEDRSLQVAVDQAYHTLLQVGRHPMAVIFVEIDPTQVDVNVHPQKAQVRFAAERRVFSAVQQAVRRAVVDAAPIPGLGVEEGTLRPARPAAPATSPFVADGWAARRTQILSAGQTQPDLDLFVPPGGAAAPAHRDASHPLVTPEVRRLPPLRVVGQVGALYVVAEGPDGLFLIDQHAAHERILYEKFMAGRDGSGAETARQQLLEPLILHVGSILAGAVAEHLALLGMVGFEVEPFGGDTFRVRAVPAVLAGQEPGAVLQEIVQTIDEGRNRVDEELEMRLVKMICKRAAIKAGQSLSTLEMQELVRQLEECQSPRTCPHGRPTMIGLSAGELERAFGRE